MAQKLAMATRGKQDQTAIQISYLAGILDADGSISISKMKAGAQRTTAPRYVLTINVVNTSRELMEWLVEAFSGRYKVRRKAQGNHRATYDWWFNNGKALPLLKTVEPYLLIKKERVLLAIEFLEGWVTIHGGRGSKTPVEEVERREAFYQKMKQLNRTGLCSRND
ncbi:LAGLIDADG family homing endonuclease [Kushneria aurantia]|uniref:LAGLIDADG family homing endonuclease n=1 Tax=Kushneria aurantia TaxID=504092 RepID=A0ABV6G4S9_9GAMM|nr:LAGLIDADG family homing endonuclease [Kushneria aurantia]